MNHARFDILARTDGALRLSKAVLIYEGQSGGAFATLHDIEDIDGLPTIQSGKAMTPRAALRLARELGKGVAQGGFLPETVLYMDGDLLLWWVPAAKRQVWFRAGDIGPADRGEVVPHPGLVFAASSQHWSVWAVKGLERPTPDSALYQAPYFNVDASGGICQGNVAIPHNATGTTAEKIGAWNDAFFNSYFTHPNVHKGLVSYRGGACQFWRHLLDGKFSVFPEKVLVDRKCQLRNVRDLLEDHGARHA